PDADRCCVEDGAEALLTLGQGVAHPLMIALSAHPRLGRALEVSVLDSDYPDAHNLIVNRHRVIAVSPMPDLIWIGLVRAGDLDVKDRLAAVHCSPVKRLELRPERRYQFGHRASHLLVNR